MTVLYYQYMSCIVINLKINITTSWIKPKVQGRLIMVTKM